MTTFADAVNYLRPYYGEPLKQASAWGKRLTPAQTAPKRATRPAAPKEKLLFDLDNFKIRECKIVGCTCDNYHHEYERRRNPARYNYSEIPCPNVFKGTWQSPILCKNRDKCQLAHTVVEGSYHPRTFKTNYCKQYDCGRCRYGDKCAYIHGDDDEVAKQWERMKNQKQRKIEEAKQVEAVTIKVDNSHLQAQKAPPPDPYLNGAAEHYVPDFAPLSSVEVMNMNMEKKIEMLCNKLYCGICNENEKDIALVPCGHVFCASCLDNTFYAECPVCRRAITSKLSIFLYVSVFFFLSFSVQFSSLALLIYSILAIPVPILSVRFPRVKAEKPFTRICFFAWKRSAVLAVFTLFTVV